MDKYLENLVKSKSGNLWQSEIWANFQKNIGRKVKLIEKNKNIALLIKHNLYKNLSWIEIARGPVFLNEKNTEIIKEIINFAKEENAVFIRFSSYKKLEIQGIKLKNTKYDHHPENTLIIDLEKTEDEILKNMKQKARYNIKIAKKNGVLIEKSNNVDEFYKILSITSKRDGFSIHKKSYYQKMLESMSENCCLFLAKYQNKVIAGGIFVYLEDYATYYYGASDNTYRNIMPTYLLQWYAIKEAKNRNCKYYDFLGVSPENNKNHYLAGVSEFKRKFGGKTINYPQAKDLVIKPIYYFLYHIYKKFR